MLRRRATTRARQIEVSVVDAPADEIEAMVARAARAKKKGDERKAMQILRTACLLDEWRPRTFAMLGAWLLEAGLRREARERLRHAQWLLTRAGEPGRAHALDTLVAAAAESAA